MSNDELFRRYDNELVLRLHSAKNLQDTRIKLSEFADHLGARRPSPDLAKSFLHDTPGGSSERGTAMPT